MRHLNNDVDFIRAGITVQIGYRNILYAALNDCMAILEGVFQCSEQKSGWTHVEVLVETDNIQLFRELCIWVESVSYATIQVYETKTFLH